ncbi:MAG: phosphoribosylamine--glycine ligase [Bacteroidota bacterium]
MRILVIGSGGREHALVWKISQSPRVTKLYCAPGNPGISEIAECVPIAATDSARLLEFATVNKIDLTIVGPEQPLAQGIVDLFEQHGLRIFGPTKNAARLEWSKGFAKDFMSRHHIPTAAYRAFSQSELTSATAYIKSQSFPLVLKADGLAAGKGVVICQTQDEAILTLEQMMNRHAFGSAGDTVVVEEFMEGEEASIFAVCDGTSFVTLAPAQDHKRVFDGDKGKNTGGMGAYAPAPVVSSKIMEEVITKIIKPTLKGMNDEGHPYKGCLYVGVMITAQGPKVVEYNCRFGDPETQVILPLYDGDLVELLAGSADRKLNISSSPVATGSALCVILASHGYPDTYTTGHLIHGLEDVARIRNTVVFHSGTSSTDKGVVTSGGRVLAVMVFDKNAGLDEVFRHVYDAVAMISFDGMHYRSDIGYRALGRIIPAPVTAI